ncbi:GNAT family N-acetyltransferase [Microbacterium gorillae]|uniref:GNAT family N-acetyltransferase n=1 Tax=Microbacterium gorillae TaxID=1231063 RepID=UPI00058DBBC8|nr:GNAT family N-acetyltransferase [Microbacterium gorillae]
MTDLTIRAVPITAATAVPDADLIAATVVRNDVYAAMGGTRDEDIPPETFLQEFTGTSQRHHLWVIERGGAVVALARLDVPLDAGATHAYAEVLVLPPHWGVGIGSAGVELVERTAAEAGRDSLTAWAEHPADARVPQLAAPTGFGTVPEDHIARFLQQHAYVLEQVERKSVFDLSGDLTRVRELLRDAEEHAAGYEVLTWVGATPAELQAPMAELRRRMSIDVPSADLNTAEENWDAARVRENDARVLASGVLRQWTVARHIDSGALVAYNVLGRLTDPESITEQGDTLVHGDHRGHRLGMLVKCRGILSWHEQSPRSPRILTWNAEENRPMLAINEALGFVPAGYVGAWQKRIR